jgi:uncharacterized protein YbjT (DUF2867 family)
MKVALFGSTGGAGRQLLQQALETGYEVVAYARDVSNLERTEGIEPPIPCKRRDANPLGFVT